jgi:hypothetical protein
MTFGIFVNGNPIYQPYFRDLTLINPKLTLEMGKAGSLSFRVPKTHRYYSALDQLTTIVTVEMDDEEIFRGRVLNNSRDFNNVRTIYCEGDLAYLIDSVQQGEKYEGKAHDLFRKIIAAHNARVESAKQFTVGNITVENRDVLLAGRSDDIQDAETGAFDYKQIAINSVAEEWMTTFDYIDSTLIEYGGGYLRTRRQNGVSYIDFLQDYGSQAVQKIEFGKNLLDITEEVSADDLFTVLIPLGDENLTIKSVNGGSDELVDTEAVARYGRIVRTHVFDSVTKPETLLENGRRYLQNNVNVPTTITVKAIDFHLVDPKAPPIRVGDRVQIDSLPHGMQDYLTCTKIEYDFENHANDTYTFGNPKQTLTERYRKDKQESKSGGGRGGGAGGAAAGEVAEEAKKELDELFDAYINVNPEAGHITLGTLHELYKEGKKTLYQFCGIDLDAPSGNINIKNMREDIDAANDRITKQSARIDLINEANQTYIDMTVSRFKKIEDLESGHFAQLKMWVNDLESGILLKADKVTVESISTSLSATQSDLDDAKNVLKKTCGIDLDSSGSSSNVNIRTLFQKVDTQGKEIETSKAAIETISNDFKAQIVADTKRFKDLEDGYTSSSTQISQLSTDLRSQINLVTNFKKQTEDGLARNESSIKALSTSTDSRLTLMSKSVDENANSIATLELLTSTNGNSIATLKADTVNIDAKVVNITGRISALELEYAKIDTLISNKITATFTSSFKLTAGSITAALVQASAMTIDNKTVATQDWVKEMLKNYSKKTHTHTFSGSTTLKWGHVHTTSTTFAPGQATQGVKNYQNKTIEISGTTGGASA